MKLLLSSCLFLCVCGLSSYAELVDVYLASGQSNAKKVWAEAIETELQSLTGDQSLVVVNSTHPGHWLSKWWNDEGQQQDTVDDIEALQKTFTEIRSHGDTPVFKGVFWFQGEGDTGSYAAIKIYKERFYAYIDALKNAFDAKDITVVVTVIDGNSDPAYDDPKKLAGRKREQVEAMRAVLLEIGDEANGFAIDSRPYKRGDAWHIKPDGLTDLGKSTATRYYQEILQPE